ncbi:spermine synthase [Mycobacterium sp. CBMA293]|uniref:spermidine synthase n=2 Tax=Mycolicibacterium TaxID=1866885 RepID=UPI0013296474|nr:MULTISPECIES: fused MFS/spermidine synthase [unclassified Mycolicibacterium]MUL46027.1 spermine synthase [Mycolicibacterium sp. CBMA 360]MUL95085.1 spermine synthase [Mycolicibacterium sp. CBMA 230]MUL60699.1 spermine synthase [Mycolicibacterium sp. CBMA 335]MUL72514.1 spermine synthase [Mycolicibacterium sp. CBMA 311]MUM07097.1 spermine synthase [Mycolicibacterium sp. CBMA 213]
MGRSRQTDQTVTQQVDSGIAELIPDPDLPRAWTLLLNSTPQSHVDLDDPTHLEFEYVRRLAHVVDVMAPDGDPLRVLHLGGGALTLPRYIATTRPRSGQQVVEVDGALVDLVRDKLPVDRTWRLRVRRGDAREVLAKAPAAAFDLVVTDVFSGARTPAHLTSLEFVSLAAQALMPGGIYTANIADGGQLAFARAQVATAQAVFGHVCLLAEPTVLRGRRFGNLILVASHAELPLADLTRRLAGDPFIGRMEHGESLDRFVAGAKPVTDATATRSPTPPVGMFGVSG